MSAARPFLEGPKIRVDALTLARGERVLVEGLSFEASPGDFVEVRGPNGSGKTTLLRALAGFVKPDGGRIVLEGVEEPALALHYIGHLNGSSASASVRAHIRYWVGLFGGCDDAGVLDRLRLSAQAELPVRVLSQGQARRLALARLLLAPRPIWLLDEPAAGLDSQGRDMLRALIGEHRDAGGVAIASLHEPLGPAPALSLTLGA